jgi:hypothetical protein
MGAGPAAEDSFGPEVIFAALRESGVRCRLIGFVAGYASQLNRQKHPATPAPEGHRPRSHAENKDRLAGVLRELGATVRPENGTPEAFTGDGAALTDGRQSFRTPHGDIEVSVGAPVVDQARPDMDPLPTGLTISIHVSISSLRSSVATGKFPGLEVVLDSFEIFQDADPEP